MDGQKAPESVDWAAIKAEYITTGASLRGRKVQYKRPF